MEAKKNYMVTLSHTVVKTETYLIQNETKEDAIYIAENQNSSPRYDCHLYNETESDPEDEFNTVKEVSFEKTEDGKNHYWKEIGEKNDK